MPTYISFKIDDLDNELKKEDVELANFADFTTRRTRAYSRALAEYSDSLAQSDDLHVRADTFAAPIDIGDAVVATTTGDIYEVDLPADTLRVAGNAIMVSKAATADFVNVQRMTWDSIVASGSSQTPYAFWENHGKLYIYDKDGANFDNASSVNFNYYRMLDSTQTTGTALDIKQKDFTKIVADTLGYMKD